MICACRHLEMAGFDGAGAAARPSRSTGNRSEIDYDHGEIKTDPHAARVPLSAAGAARRTCSRPRERGSRSELRRDASGNLYFRSSDSCRCSARGAGIRSLENGIGLSRSFHAVTRVRDVNNKSTWCRRHLSKAPSASATSTGQGALPRAGPISSTCCWRTTFPPASRS